MPLTPRETQQLHPFWQKLAMQRVAIPGDLTNTPPNGVPFQLGQKVKFTNDNGASRELEVLGFGDPTRHVNGRCVYVFTDCWWFPAKPSSLQAVS